MSIITKLQFSINANDATTVLSILDQVELEITGNNFELIDEVVTPAIINSLFSSLEDVMGVPRRLLMLKNRVVHRKSRALLFVRLMKNGVIRSCKTDGSN